MRERERVIGISKVQILSIWLKLIYRFWTLIICRKWWRTSHFEKEKSINDFFQTK